MFNTANVPFQSRQWEPYRPHLPFFPTTPSPAWLTPRSPLLSWAQFRLQLTSTVLKKLHSAVQVVHVFQHFFTIVVVHGWFLKKNISSVSLSSASQFGWKTWEWVKAQKQPPCRLLCMCKYLKGHSVIHTVCSAKLCAENTFFWCLLINLVGFANAAAGSLVPFCS